MNTQQSAQPIPDILDLIENERQDFRRLLCPDIVAYTQQKSMADRRQVALVLLFNPGLESLLFLTHKGAEDDKRHNKNPIQGGKKLLEDLVKTCTREIEEEVGLTHLVGGPIYLGSEVQACTNRGKRYNRIESQYFHVYFCTTNVDDLEAKETHIKSVEWIQLDKIRDVVFPRLSLAKHSVLSNALHAAQNYQEGQLLPDTIDFT